MKPARLTWIRFRGHRAAFASLILLGLLFALCFSAQLIAEALGVSGTAVDLLAMNMEPSGKHWLGTDELGRDILIRLLAGGQVSLTVGLIAALCAALIGTTIGLVAGYRGGLTDAVLMRLTDGVIALPLLPLLIVLAAVDLGKLGLSDSAIADEATQLMRIVLIVALAGWTTVARLVRAQALSLRTRTFVLAARSQGASTRFIILRHVLPNLASPIIVATTLATGQIILLESVLSFLGLGIQPPTPSWGNQLTNAQELIWSAPALALWPGLAIFTTVIAFNFLGDGLQDALDPRAKP
ncbi:MAG: ABC transporter permease [Magnetovibrionaceae bacterium]